PGVAGRVEGDRRGPARRRLRAEVAPVVALAGHREEAVAGPDVAAVRAQFRRCGQLAAQPAASLLGPVRERHGDRAHCALPLGSATGITSSGCGASGVTCMCRSAWAAIWEKTGAAMMPP